MYELTVPGIRSPTGSSLGSIKAPAELHSFPEATGEKLLCCLFPVLESATSHSLGLLASSKASKGQLSLPHAASV